MTGEQGTTPPAEGSLAPQQPDRAPSAGREFPVHPRDYDLVVIGGGMAGMAAAVTASRRGLSTALIQDRPSLGGNASTEIRVNLEGANGGGHNRFFVESGLAEDLLLENLWRNPTGSGDHWGALLLDLVLAEDDLDLYPDTVADHVETDADGSLVAVEALTLAAEQRWRFQGRYFVDATGDGSIAYLAGAEYLYGEEGRDAFDEPLAPAEASDLTLGGTMWFMCKDVGRPVEFTPPAFARRVSEEELRVNRGVNVWQQKPILGGFWWVEYGGDLDTIADNPTIKHVLLSEVFGLWDYVKNHPDHRERNATLDLEWVAAMPGKRESRRFLGDHVLTEHDLVSTTRFPDGVAFGGWSIDRHTPRGMFDFDQPPCVQVHPPGVYQIPLRSLYSRDVGNLFLAGRDISYSHVACCSARVMLTCTDIGEAVGEAAALAAETDSPVRRVATDDRLLADLHTRLERIGHYVPYRELTADRIPTGATVRASSEAPLAHEAVTSTVELDRPRMLSFPVTADRLDSVEVWVSADTPTELSWRLFDHDPQGRWIVGPRLSAGTVSVGPDDGRGRWVTVRPAVDGLEGYVHLALAADGDGATLGVSEERPLGPLTWRNIGTELDAVAVDEREEKGWNLTQRFEEWGDSASYPFSHWRRDGHGWGGPPGPAIAFRVTPNQPIAPAAAVLEPFERPTVAGTHAWVSDRCEGAMEDGRFVLARPEWLEITLPEPVATGAIEVYWNSDLDRHLANLWYAHPPGIRAMSTLPDRFDLEVCDPDGTWRVVDRVEGHHQRRHRVAIDSPILGLRVTVHATHGEPQVSLTDIRLRTRSSS